MSAQDNLSPQQFYHGTGHSLRAGQVISAAGANKVWGSGEAPSTHVYATHDLETAKYYASMASERVPGATSSHVYSVRPIGRVSEDENHPGEDSWKSKSMRVLGEV